MTYNDTFIRACRKQAVDHIPRMVHAAGRKV